LDAGSTLGFPYQQLVSCCLTNVLFCCYPDGREENNG